MQKSPPNLPSSPFRPPASTCVPSGPVSGHLHVTPVAATGHGLGAPPREAATTVAAGVRQKCRCPHRLPCYCAAAGRARLGTGPYPAAATKGGRSSGLMARRWRQVAPSTGRPLGPERRRWQIWRAFLHIFVAPHQGVWI